MRRSDCRFSRLIESRVGYGADLGSKLVKAWLADFDCHVLLGKAYGGQSEQCQEREIAYWFHGAVYLSGAGDPAVKISFSSGPRYLATRRRDSSRALEPPLFSNRAPTHFVTACAKFDAICRSLADVSGALFSSFSVSLAWIS